METIDKRPSSEDLSRRSASRSTVTSEGRERVQHSIRAHVAEPRVPQGGYDEVLRTIENDIRRSRSPSKARSGRRAKRRNGPLWIPFLGAVGVLAILYFFFL